MFAFDVTLVETYCICRNIHCHFLKCSIKPRVHKLHVYKKLGYKFLQIASGCRNRKRAKSISTNKEIIKSPKSSFPIYVGSKCVCVSGKHNLLLCILQFYDLAQFFFLILQI